MHFRQQIVQRLEARLNRFVRRRWEERGPFEKAFAVIFALGFWTVRELRRDRGTDLAASLAFMTVLSIVPLLSVATSLLGAFGILDAEDNILLASLQQVFPRAAGDIVGYLRDLATASAQAMGGIGAVTLIVIGLVLFNSIERALTDIWRGSHDRSKLTKFLTFYAMITLGPLLIALSIIQSVKIQLYLSQIGLDVGWSDRLLPVFYTLVVFTLMNKLLPNAPVEWKAALVGGLFTAVAFELAKWGFNLYVNQILLQTYNRLYGALTLVPLFMVWVYLTWLVILLGAEMAYSYQHLKGLFRAEAGERAAKINLESLRVYSPSMAAEILAPIAAAFAAGAGPVSEVELVEQTEYSQRIVRDVVDRLLEVGLVVEAKTPRRGPRQLVPARPLEEISLTGLVDPFWVESGGNVAPLAREVVGGYHRVTREFFAAFSARELAGKGRAARTKPAPENEEPLTIDSGSS